MQLILIAGKAGVGKTTLAKMIAEEAFHLGLLPKLVSFAGPIKTMAAERGYAKEDHPEKYRDFCQAYGGIKREEDPDYWVKRYDMELLKTLKNEKLDIAKKKKHWERCIIADDCRYLNEVGLGMRYKAILLFISYGDRSIPHEDDEWRLHHSEELATKTEAMDKEYLDIFTHVVMNDKDIKSLKKKAKELTPLWCGLELAETSDCPCESCDARREGRRPSKNQCISDLIDLLLLGQIQDDEEEEDEDTEEGLS